MDPTSTFDVVKLNTGAEASYLRKMFKPTRANYQPQCFCMQIYIIGI